MNKISFLFLLLFSMQNIFAQDSSFVEKELTIDRFTDGTLTTPLDSTAKNPLIIFIQGSGPTNRDGNAPMMKNDGMKKIAHQLAENRIASFRFDKRIFKMNKYGIREEDLRFEDFVTDVNAIISHFSKEDRFSKIIIAGHSEGSLIGLLAANQNEIDGFISLAGAGRSIDQIIVEQLAKQSETLADNAQTAFEEIKIMGSTSNYSPYLESIFRPSVQPYIKSWMQYDPAAEIAKLEVPILIINGSFDLQVDVKDAELLKNAYPEAELVILENMNHIFREIKGENLENTKAYNEPQRPLHPELIPAITQFVHSIE